MFRPFAVHAPEGDTSTGGATSTTAPPAPAAATPPAGGAPGGAPASGAAAAGAPPGPGNLIADGKPGEGAAPGAPVTPTKDEQVAFLTSKGLKPEDIGKLDDAGLKAKHDELKAADVKAEAIKGIDIKVPDGAVIDEKSMTALKEILAEAKVPNELGQKLFDLYTSKVKEQIEGPVKLWMDTQAAWQAEIKADPEMGGTKLQANTEAIAKFIDAVGGADAAKIREAFVFTGAGNNPAMFRFMARAAKAFVEGKHVSGAAPGTAKTGDFAAAAAAMYPSSADGSGGASTRIP